MQRWSKTVLIVFLSILFYGQAVSAKEFLRFTGGPGGGTFQYFSNGIALRLSKNVDGLRVSTQSSKGSVQNIRKVENGRADFGIAYSGDLYLARNGKLMEKFQ